MVTLDAHPGSGEGSCVKHRHALLAAIALASVIALLLVGRVRAAEPGPAWTPSPTDTWDYQLASGSIDLRANADVYDVDAFAVKGTTVAAMQAGGTHVICYIDAGSYESVPARRRALPGQRAWQGRTGLAG